jgi:DNA (cytosine-5)-methyltransferase 1
VKHYGDVSKISGSQIEPVDIITFGSPCQDLSVAGKREGMKHAEQGDEETTRSGLFYEAIRIIEEMREATNGEYPKYAVWENVPGAFSSNKGRDFHAVLEAFCSVCDDTVSIPKPYDPKRTDRLVWNKSGEIVGDNYSVAWRTLDAQYWGVPQRRKRIYLVADFTGRRAGEILFKPESLRGDFAQGDETGQEVATDAVGSVNGSSGNGGQLAATVISSYGTKWNGNAGAYNGENFVLQKPSSEGSVRAAGVVSKGNGECFIMPERHMSLSIGGGQAGQGYPCAVYSFDSLSSNSMKSSNPNSGCRAVEIAKCIDTTCPDPSKNQGGIAIVQPVIALQANGIDGSVGAAGFKYGNSAQARSIGYEEERSPTLAGTPGGNQLPVVVYEPASLLDENWKEVEAKNSLRANASKSSHAVVQETKPPRKYIIRRLTPTECARLQGFPDWWGQLAPYDPADAEFWEDVRKTHAEINGKKYKPVKDIKKWYDKLHTDSAEYKMWGNGIALPNAEYVMRGVASQGAKTLGSLFDGSGGFPLAGTMNGIKPLWASEVEPFPIAVTKSRFKEEQE